MHFALCVFGTVGRNAHILFRKTTNRGGAYRGSVPIVLECNWRPSCQVRRRSDP